MSLKNSHAVELTEMTRTHQDKLAELSDALSTARGHMEQQQKIEQQLKSVHIERARLESMLRTVLENMMQELKSSQIDVAEATQGFMSQHEDEWNVFGQKNFDRPTGQKKGVGNTMRGPVQRAGWEKLVQRMDVLLDVSNMLLGRINLIPDLPRVGCVSYSVRAAEGNLPSNEESSEVFFHMTFVLPPCCCSHVTVQCHK
jgi:hypothetical protein